MYNAQESVPRTVILRFAPCLQFTAICSEPSKSFDTSIKEGSDAGRKVGAKFRRCLAGTPGAAKRRRRKSRRRYNREFMRRWRADPSHHAMERSQRQQRYYAGRNSSRSRQTPSSRQRANGGEAAVRLLLEAPRSEENREAPGFRSRAGRIRKGPHTVLR